MSTEFHSFVLYLEPMLNSYSNKYQNVITLSTMPPGPLARMVSTYSPGKLSPFQEPSSVNCVPVLIRGPSIKRADYFMGADDIPYVFSFLQSNGYTIDTKLTKMMNTSAAQMGGVSEMRVSGNRKMICWVTYTPMNI